MIEERTVLVKSNSHSLVLQLQAGFTLNSIYWHDRLLFDR
jgi:hypothetical protein